MAIPGIPSTFNLQTANQKNFLSWDITAGATSYSVLRSTNGLTYTQIAAPTTNYYLDESVLVGVLYYYKVAAASTTPNPAAGQIVFSGMPLAGESFSVANVTYTAVASGATASQFNLGATVADTIANMVATLNAAAAPTANEVIGVATNSTTLTLSAYEPGVQGNGIQLSSALSNTFIIPFSGGVTGTLSPYTVPQSAVPAPAGESSLGQIRLQSQQRADLVNSNFVSLTEWNSYINQSLFELYDLLIAAYGEDYFAAPALQFVTDGSSQFFDLPNGTNYDAAPPFYKLLGIDLGLNAGAQSNNGWVSITKFNFIDRNKYFYPNTQSTIYGVFNMQYRLYGNKVEFIPTPSGNQPIRLWYIPRMTMLLQDTDTTTAGVSGWLEYVIVDSAIKAMQKEESDVSVLMAQKQQLLKRIEALALNRDAGVPDTISDTRSNGNGYGGWGGSSGQGFGAGW